MDTLGSTAVPPSVIDTTILFPTPVTGCATNYASIENSAGTNNPMYVDSSNPRGFVGEAEVDTSEGRFRLDWLVEMARGTTGLPLAYSWDLGSDLPVLRQINRVGCTGEATDMVRVTTDKGLSFVCTPDQQFLTRTDYYVAANHLKPGNRLRKFGRFINSRRSNRRYINHRETETHPNGTQNLARWLWTQARGPIPPGMDVHHLNEVPFDDRISNYELKNGIDHQRDHSKGGKNCRFIAVDERQLVEVWEGIEADQKLRNRKSQVVTPGKWNKYIRDNHLQGVIPIAFSAGGGRIRGLTWPQFGDHIEESRGLVNDTVMSIEAVTLNVPVKIYNMEIEGASNFAIGTPLAIHSILVRDSSLEPTNFTRWKFGAVHNTVPASSPGMLAA